MKAIALILVAITLLGCSNDDNNEELLLSIDSRLNTLMEEIDAIKQGDIFIEESLEAFVEMKLDERNQEILETLDTQVQHILETIKTTDKERGSRNHSQYHSIITSISGYVNCTNYREWVGTWGIWRENDDRYPSLVSDKRLQFEFGEKGTFKILSESNEVLAEGRYWTCLHTFILIAEWNDEFLVRYGRWDVQRHSKETLILIKDEVTDTKPIMKRIK